MDKVKIVSINWSEVARMTGLSRATVYRWRDDRRKCSVAVDEAIRNALAKLYNIGISDFEIQS